MSPPKETPNIIKADDISTMWSMASSIKKETSDTSIYQIMWSIYLGNKNAFIDGNINLVRKDMDLVIPSFATMKMTSQADAKESILAMNSSFSSNFEPAVKSLLTLTAPKIADAGFIADANGAEQIIFQTTASAVNEVEITNAATGNAPIIGSSGETNVDLNLTPKGTGRVVLGAGAIQNLTEKATISATAATGTINYDVRTQAVLYYTSAATGNFTVNVRGDGSTTLNNIMDTGESVTLAFLVTCTGSAYYNNAFTIDGASVTPEWQGGSAPSAGNTNSIDVYTYTIFKTGDAAFTALAAQSQFA